MSHAAKRCGRDANCGILTQRFLTVRISRKSGKGVRNVLTVEETVLERYSRGAAEREESLCCPVEYDGRYLDAIPAEVIERDYGCGDPSAWVEPGEVVLDLGSGSGKICFIASQVVGPTGRVIGVDMNSDMLALARRHQPDVASRIGYDNVRFLHGRIQDLRTDLDAI